MYFIFRLQFYFIIPLEISGLCEIVYCMLVVNYVSKHIKIKH